MMSVESDSGAVIWYSSIRRFGIYLIFDGYPSPTQALDGKRVSPKMVSGTKS